METKLDELVDKSVKVRDSLSRTLVKNFPIEKDYADFLAMDVVNQAIGVDALERYNREKELEKERKEREARSQARKAMVGSVLGVIFGGVLPAMLVIVIIGWAVMGIHSCATKSPYPRLYKPIPEHARFVDTERSSWKGDQVYGLSDANNLCVTGFGTDGRGGLKGASETCIHRNKVESLNQAMQRAVETNADGVIWNEPNGNGEVWSVARNNYRFVITATDDESFIEP